MTIRYYIPADSEAGARKVVDGIERGVVPALLEYLDPELCAEAFDRYPPGAKIGKRLWCIERRAVDDGIITNAWTVDEIGERAATIALFLLIPLVGNRKPLRGDGMTAWQAFALGCLVNVAIYGLAWVARSHPLVDAMEGEHGNVPGPRV